MDVYAITSMQIEHMHCIIGVYVNLQHIDVHIVHRMNYFEDSPIYTFVIQAKTMYL